MIELTRLNGNPLMVNCDLIKHAEAAPDTVLTLVTGDKLIVRESCHEVCRRTLAYRASVLSSAWPEAAAFLAVRGGIQACQVAAAEAHTLVDSGR